MELIRQERLLIPGPCSRSVPCVQGRQLEVGCKELPFSIAGPGIFDEQRRFPGPEADSSEGAGEEAFEPGDIGTDFCGREQHGKLHRDGLLHGGRC